MIVKYQFQSYSFLYLELRKDPLDIETTTINWKKTLSQTFLRTFIQNSTFIYSFYLNLHLLHFIQSNIKDSLHKRHIIVNNLKKKILKQIASEILQNGNMLDININNHFHSYVYLTLLTLKFINLNILNQRTHMTTNP